MVNGETYILGIEDRHLPHKVGPVCLHLHNFCLRCHSTILAGQGVCKQKMDSRCVDFNILKIEGGDEIRRNRE